MAPTDYFIGFRHFFGYLVPGTLWATGVLLLLCRHPNSLSDWFSIGAFIVGSYLLGYSMQGPLFDKLLDLNDWFFRNRSSGMSEGQYQLLRAAIKELLAARAQERTPPSQVDAYLASLTDNDLEVFSKRYVMEFSSYLRDELVDYEGTINFVVGVIPALLMLAIGSGFYLRNHPPPELPSASIWVPALLVAAALWLFFVRLHNKRRAEREVWFSTFFVLLAGPVR